MKRFIIAILLVCFVLILSACGGMEETPTTQASTAAPQTQAPATAAPQTQAPATTAAQTQAPATAAPQTQAPATTAAHVHSFGAWTTVKNATCVADGAQERYCSCGEKQTATIPATGVHSFGAWKTVTAATCTEAGTEERSCSVCGAKETQEIPALGHEDANGVCKRCGIKMLAMTAQEKTDAKKVESLYVNVVGGGGSQYSILIYLYDADNRRVEVPAFVDVRVVNTAGVTVYEKTREMSSTSGGIGIQSSDLTPGTTNKGTFFITVYNPGYFQFEEIRRSTDNLPWTIDLQLPSLPSEYSYYGKHAGGSLLDSTCRLETVTFVGAGDYTHNLVFTGTKTYDRSGSDYQRMCAVNYKLIDSDGVTVMSDYFITSELTVGEKFRVEKNVSGLEPGKTYTLVLYDHK